MRVTFSKLIIMKSGQMVLVFLPISMSILKSSKKSTKYSYESIEIIIESPTYPWGCSGSK